MELNASLIALMELFTMVINVLHVLQHAEHVLVLPLLALLAQQDNTFTIINVMQLAPLLLSLESAQIFAKMDSI